MRPVPRRSLAVALAWLLVLSGAGEAHEPLLGLDPPPDAREPVSSPTPNLPRERGAVLRARSGAPPLMFSAGVSRTQRVPAAAPILASPVSGTPVATSAVGSEPSAPSLLSLPDRALLEEPVVGRGLQLERADRHDGTEELDLCVGGATVGAFLHGRRQSADLVATSGGREIAAAAGLELRTTDAWSLRVQVQQEFLNALGDEPRPRELSVGLRRRF